MAFQGYPKLSAFPSIPFPLMRLSLTAVVPYDHWSYQDMPFCGNHEAAENTAIIYSLLGSCKERGVTPREWLK